MPQSPAEMAQAMVANMPDKTGKSIDEWLQVLKGKEELKHGQLTKLLKTDHGLTHGYAQMIAHIFMGGIEAFNRDEDEEVRSQYAGAKESLRPWYDTLAKAIMEFGSDVQLAPKKGYVSFRRNRQFATIKPATKTRMDIGIHLKGDAGTDRLREQTASNAMLSHQVSINSQNDIDAELIGWLKLAYEKA